MISPVPSMNWFRVFEAAARCGTFVDAADALGMTPSAVSQQIAALEQNLGTKLFVRQGRGVILSVAGENLYPVIGEALRSVEMATATIRQGSRERIVVHSDLLLAGSWIAGALAVFTSMHPSHDIELRTEGPPGLDTDIEISFEKEARALPGFLIGEAVFPVALPRFGRPPGIAQEYSATLIEVVTHRNSWLECLSAVGVRSLQNVRFITVDNTVTAIALAAAGVGIALARSPVTDRIAAAFGLVACSGFPPLPSRDGYVMAINPRRAHRAPVRQFAASMTAYAARHECR